MTNASNISINIGNSNPTYSTWYNNNTGVNMNEETVKVIVIEDGNIYRKTYSKHDYQNIKQDGVTEVYRYFTKTNGKLPIASLQHNVVDDYFIIWRYIERALSQQLNLYVPFIVRPAKIPFEIYIRDTVYG